MHVGLPLVCFLAQRKLFDLVSQLHTIFVAFVVALVSRYAFCDTQHVSYSSLTLLLSVTRRVYDACGRLSHDNTTNSYSCRAVIVRTKADNAIRLNISGLHKW